MPKLSARALMAVKHYVNTGEHDPNNRDWPGNSFIEVEVSADRAMRGALIKAVLKRTSTLTNVQDPPVSDLIALTRNKVTPMVNGLFTLAERSTVLATLEKSVVFLTPSNIAHILQTSPWLGTTWDLANMYLLERGTKPLAPDAPKIVGLSSETTCYLGLDYLSDWRDDGFDDYLVHEAAHVFHNCRRCTIGLTETRGRKVLLNIAFAKRETFAYACEAYSRILTMAKTRKSRCDALAKHAAGPLPGADAMDHQEYLEILSNAVNAVNARNGWKHILQACSPHNARLSP